MLVDIGELVDWLQNSINQAIANYHRTNVLDCKSSPADVFPRTVSICYTHKNFGRVIQMNEWICVSVLIHYVLLFGLHIVSCVFFVCMEKSFSWLKMNICGNLQNNIFIGKPLYILPHLSPPTGQQGHCGVTKYEE